MTAWPLLLALGVNPLWLVWDCGDTIKCLSCHPFLKPPEGDSVLSSVPLSSLHLKCSLNPWCQSDPPNQAWIILSLGAWLSVLLCHIQNVAPYGVFAYEHVALPTGGTVLWDEIGEMQREKYSFFSHPCDIHSWSCSFCWNGRQQFLSVKGVNDIDFSYWGHRLCFFAFL